MHLCRGDNTSKTDLNLASDLILGKVNGCLITHSTGELDKTGFDAYGWPATLSDAEILERLVAMGQARKVGNAQFIGG